MQNTNRHLLQQRLFNRAIGQSADDLAQDKTATSWFQHFYCLYSAKEFRKALNVAVEWGQSLGISGQQLSAMALAFYGSGNGTAGNRAAEQASKKQSEEPYVLLANARRLLSQGDVQIALDNLQKAIALLPTEPLFYVALTDIFYLQGRDQEAISSLESGMEACPFDPELALRLARLLAGTGRIDEARALLSRQITKTPRFGAAYQELFNLKGDLSSSEAQLLADFANDTECIARDRMFLSFALGKLLDRNKVYDEAFLAFEKANKIRRMEYDYDVNEHVRFYRQLTDGPMVEQQGTQFPENGQFPIPIFIVGMPRSGSTLLEQSLAQHSEIGDAGETKSLQTVLSRHGLETTDPFGTDHHDKALLQTCRQEYLVELKALSDKPYVVDKLLFNFSRIGWIKKLFPEACIIHMQRDFMANGWAIYTQYFAEHLPFAYDLREIGAFTAACDEMMARWQTIYPDSIHVVTYENMVTDFEGTMKALFEYLGLVLPDNVQTYRKRGEHVHGIRTASYIQVQQDLYASSLDRWKSYEPWLGSLARERKSSEQE